MPVSFQGTFLLLQVLHLLLWRALVKSRNSKYFAAAVYIKIKYYLEQSKRGKAKYRNFSPRFLNVLNENAFHYTKSFLASHSCHNCKFLANGPCSSLQMVYIAMKLGSSYCMFNRHKLEYGNLRQPNMLQKSFLKSPMVSLEGQSLNYLKIEILGN